MTDALYNTAEVRMLLDWSGPRDDAGIATTYTPEISIRYGCCGNWETVSDPAEFGRMATWHRTFCDNVGRNPR